MNFPPPGPGPAVVLCAVFGRSQKVPEYSRIAPGNGVFGDKWFCLPAKISAISISRRNSAPLGRAGLSMYYDTFMHATTNHGIKLVSGCGLAEAELFFELRLRH